MRRRELSSKQPCMFSAGLVFGLIQILLHYVLGSTIAAVLQRRNPRQYQDKPKRLKADVVGTVTKLVAAVHNAVQVCVLLQQYVKSGNACGNSCMAN